MTSQTDAPAGPCTCEACGPAGLPVNPFLALQVAYGMLLGEDEFRTLMGNPRGKQMLHTAWLHGSGVIWGYCPSVEGLRTLKVSPGLAVDGQGRELLSDTSWCLDVSEWLNKHQDALDQECRTQTVHACLVARFGCCPTDPVPALADPCDITRQRDAPSRIVEGVRLELRLGRCPERPRPYHRVRVLLGLDDVGDDVRPGEYALRALRHVLAENLDERAEALLEAFHRLAAWDVMDLTPASEQPGDGLSLFPVLDADSAVVLACVEIDVRDRDGCIEIIEIRPDPEARTALLPTATIQELTCGAAPALLGAKAGEDAGGPRVIPDSVRWSEGATKLHFTVTAPLVPGSVSRRAVQLTSLAIRGWVEEDTYSVSYDDAERRVTVILADRPINEIVRLIVRGTGRTPVFGRDPAVPLAGLVGGPPGDVNDGHDATLTLRNPLMVEAE
jgi:hypothetical protein